MHFAHSNTHRNKPNQHARTQAIYVFRLLGVALIQSALSDIRCFVLHWCACVCFGVVSRIHGVGFLSMSVMFKCNAVTNYFPCELKLLLFSPIIITCTNVWILCNNVQYRIRPSVQHVWASANKLNPWNPLLLYLRMPNQYVFTICVLLYIWIYI